MKNTTLTETTLDSFRHHLKICEMQHATITKYMHDVSELILFLNGGELTKESLIEYKEFLKTQNYKARSINSKLSAINTFLDFLECSSLRLKLLRIQQPTYCTSNDALCLEEYLKLLDACKDNISLYLLLQTLASTGVRVSELRHFTIESLDANIIEISNKGKIRNILIPGALRDKLLEYAKENGIHSGPIFITKNRNPVNRTFIWKQLKRLGAATGIQEGKLYPHNLRKLFARTFYSMEPDLAKLADVLGHSNINTTRLYIISTCEENQKFIDKLGLVD